MEEFQIRELSESDCDQVLKTVTELCEEDLYLALLYPDAKFTRQDQLKWIKSGINEIHEKKLVRLGVFKGLEYGGAVTIEKQPGRHSHYGEFGIALKKSFRKKGLAVKISKQAIKKAKEIGMTHLFLYVAEKNTPAIKLYEKLGFEKQGKIPEFSLRKGVLDTYLIMTKKL